MSYGWFDGADSHTMRLEAGDALQGQIYTYNGWLEVEISDEDGETLLDGSPLNGDQSVDITRTGDYTILVHGRKTSGEFAFARVPAALPEEALPAEAEA